MKSRPRLVVDTNVFVSGLISESGSPGRILQGIRDKHLIHLVSDSIVEEYLRVLNYPRIRKFKQITDAFTTDIAAYLVYQAQRIEIVSNIALSQDPDNNVFLETAVDGRADLLVVTGDKADLLSPRAVEGIPIVSASEAVIRLGI
jgi:uncharacterized protein